MTSVTVVEINPDVIKLISPTIRQDPRLEIRLGDALRLQQLEGDYDTYIFDLWVYDDVGWKKGFPGKWDVRGLALFYRAKGKKVYVWGERDPEFNPAVTREPSEMYLEVVKALREKARR